MRRSFFSDRLFKFILGGLVFLFVLLIIQKAYVQPPPPPTPIYTISAHGNISYGVNRTGLSSFNYSIGNCAHCHEQHSRIGGSEPVPNSPAGPDYYLLFKDLWIGPIQSNLFCYGCHIEVGSYQSGGLIINYCYSRTRGGDTTLTCPDSVYKGFQFVDNNGVSQANCGSSVGTSHRIYDIGAFMLGKWGFSSTGAYLNPCDVCHNPHRAKRDYPCSRVSAHANLLTWDVWGDDAGTLERMNILTPNYWAPKRVGGGYEPDGCATVDCQNGSNTPNYANLCYDCHNPTNVIWSARLNKNLSQINWTVTGDFHGNRQRIDDGGDFSGSGEWGDLLAPYKVSGTYAKTNYLLSCTDCHEPHGSPNQLLLRPTVNGVNVIDASHNNGPISGSKWYYFCTACHSLTGHPMMPGPSTDCYQGGSCHKHCYGSICSTSGSF